MPKFQTCLCCVLTAPLLVGALIVAVLLTPQLAAEAFTYVPLAALVGALFAWPLARNVARFMAAPEGRDRALRWGWGL